MIDHAYLVAGLGFGDEGKGTTVDALARKVGASLVVRYNGGAQAGHHVHLPDGTSHCFSQFGSGTFAGAHTYLSPFVVIDPLALRREGAHLRHAGLGDPFSLLWVDPDCPVVTPYHKQVNVLREAARGARAHGTCGRGIGEVMGGLLHQTWVTMRAKHLGKRDTAAAFMAQIRDEAAAHARALGMVFSEPGGLTPGAWAARMVDAMEVVAVGAPPLLGTVIFEGAQGVLLDQDYGFHPHTTWSDCTFRQADLIVGSVRADQVTRIGVTRAYATRHGAGPLPTHDPDLPEYLAGEDNQAGGPQGDFRAGHFDGVLLRYALRALGGVDALAVTCVDRAARRPCWRVANEYQGGALNEARLVRDDAGQVVDLVPPGSLRSQEEMREAVATCRPSYQRSVRDPFDHVRALAKEVAPIRAWVSSGGPTHEAKAWGGAWGWP